MVRLGSVSVTIQVKISEDFSVSTFGIEIQSIGIQIYRKVGMLVKD